MWANTLLSGECFSKRSCAVDRSTSAWKTWDWLATASWIQLKAANDFVVSHHKNAKRTKKDKSSWRNETAGFCLDDFVQLLLSPFRSLSWFGDTFFGLPSVVFKIMKPGCDVFETGMKLLFFTKRTMDWTWILKATDTMYVIWAEKLFISGCLFVTFCRAITLITASGKSREFRLFSAAANCWLKAKQDVVLYPAALCQSKCLKPRRRFFPAQWPLAQ